MRGIRTKHLLAAVVCGAIAVLLLTTGVLFWKYSQLKQKPEKTTQTASDRVIGEVSAIYAVPSDEQPTVAQIQDKSKLQGQSFFDKSQNGDYVLIYSKNKLALLFREQQKKLINVGPVNIDNSASASGGTTQAQPKVAPATTSTPSNQTPTKH